jgi:TIGR03009 family protein
MSLVRRRWMAADFLRLALGLALVALPARWLAAQQPPARPPAKKAADAAANRPAAQAKPQAQRGTGPMRFGGIPQPRKPAEPADPFGLRPEQQAVVDLVLQKWEEKQKKIKTFSCEFTLFEYDGTFNQARVGNGKVYYAAPDKGKYEVFDDKGAPGEHWVCDGKSIYEFNKDAKELIERPLPEEMRGKAIVDSPLPFVFGSSAQKMAQRYWMKVTTAAEDPYHTLKKGQFLLEAIPKFQRDAGNFQKVEIIFSERDLVPVALNQFMPSHTNKNENRKAYEFHDQKVNGGIDLVKTFFSKPRTPLGWKYVVEGPTDTSDVAPPQLRLEGAQRPDAKKKSATR